MSINPGSLIGWSKKLDIRVAMKVRCKIHLTTVASLFCMTQKLFIHGSATDSGQLSFLPNVPQSFAEQRKSLGTGPELAVCICFPLLSITSIDLFKVYIEKEVKIFSYSLIRF